jgi:hypothetical protein
MRSRRARGDPEHGSNLFERQVGPVVEVEHLTLALRQPVDLRPHGDPVDCLPRRPGNEMAEIFCELCNPAPEAVLIHCQVMQRPERPRRRVHDGGVPQELAP